MATSDDDIDNNSALDAPTKGRLKTNRKRLRRLVELLERGTDRFRLLRGQLEFFGQPVQPGQDMARTCESLSGQANEQAGLVRQGSEDASRILSIATQLAAGAQAAHHLARQIDTFLTQREQNVLSKLLAIGGIQREESFEVQVKARLRDQLALQKLLTHPDIKIVKTVHYRQYDTYFLFDDTETGRVRYREDDLIDTNGAVVSVRSRLTFTSPLKEREFHQTILLSRSRFIADADRPLRFYREYFQPIIERELNKERRRWHIEYKGVLFYINVDRVTRPSLPDLFIELKARTWSNNDAEQKADLIHEMLDLIGIEPTDITRLDYLEIESIH
ncbi:MAG: hypothetical protein HC828_13215 [Blastochloris sp.]|nr:hypothetical protein [Blastochloris sp.]